VEQSISTEMAKIAKENSFTNASAVALDLSGLLICQKEISLVM
jgi:hypothetical protein